MNLIYMEFAKNAKIKTKTFLKRKIKEEDLKHQFPLVVCPAV